MFVILPVLLFQIFCEDKLDRFNGRKKSLIIGIWCSGSLILCLLFSFEIIPGYIYDLRTIPLFVSILYGGYWAGMLTTALLYLVRFYLGGDGIWNVLIVYSFMIILTFLVAPIYRELTRAQKILTATILSLLTSLLMIMNTAFRTGLPFDEYPAIVSYVLIHGFATWLSIYLIEKMRENKRAIIEIQQMEKLRLLSDFATSFEQEMSKPVKMIRYSIQNLFEKLEPEERMEYWKNGLLELEKVQSIFTNLLFLARPNMEKRERINVGEEIRYVVKVLSTFAKSQRIEIREVFLESLIVMADKDKFNQLLTHLVKNGIEAMPNGGTLKISALKNDNHVVINVMDNGVGMSREEIQQLGTPIYSAKRKRTALGMMVCYRIVETLDGKIEVNSEKGKGTRFSITLPAY